MECPFCKLEDSRVLESRSAEDGGSVRRRRECLSCNQRFTTYERVEFSSVIVIKKSLSKEFYSREKLVSSIVRSCSKAQISTLTIDEIVDRVERVIYRDYPREIYSSNIGEMVMNELKAADPIAYLRYASIFKKINSLGEFIEEMKNLEEQRINSDFEEACKIPLV